jgi:pimeloyl-ACP methyl ester carboxylesterase
MSYAPVNGLDIYYEIHGAPDAARPPLVLLHGGGDTITTSFAKILPELAKHRQVIAFEQQGYGHTADVAGRPFSFEQSADDTAALLDYLHIAQADLFGFSNGGTIAVQVAIRHPKVVRKLVLASASLQRSGMIDGLFERMEQATIDDMPQELRDAYLAVAPHPEQLQTMFEKSRDRMRFMKDIPDDAIRAITAPAFIVMGDSDVVKVEHGAQIQRLLPHAQLAVLPATDHMAVTSRIGVLVPMIETFLS